MQFREISSLKSNITSSLDFRQTYDRFGIITRQLARNSSKYVYRLEIYNYQKMQKISSVDLYQSYSEETHFIRFVADKNIVAVTTKFQIMFYQIEPLQLKKVFLHEQLNLYDLTSSPDGELVVLVGLETKVWRTNGYRPAVFPHVIASARFCAFSKDNQYMAISSNNQINIYTFDRSRGQYQFSPLKSVQSPPANQDITSIQFNPNDSNELVVGFINVSPQLFRINAGFFIPANDIQPSASKNAKKANYMPDGKRFISSDALKGLGIWPGVGNVLFYKQMFLLYDLRPNKLGTIFIGRIWQNVKAIQIQIECKPQNFRTQCQCPGDYSWDYASYSCQPLSCLQNQFATGQKRNNQCVCVSGYTFDRTQRKCVTDCRGIDYAVKLNINNGFCYCRDNYVWDLVTRKCLFNCRFIPFSTGTMISSEKCQCNKGFLWSVQLRQCVCPKYSKVDGQVCVCYDQYIEDQMGKCIIDCNSIPLNAGNLPTQQQCQCQPGYYFAEYQSQVGCKLNCSNFKDTMQLSPGFQTCKCSQKLNWVGNRCKINCGEVKYAGEQSIENQNQCKCAVNYLWITEIHECGKNCTGVQFVDQTKKSTLRSCPCIRNFNWNELQEFCQIDCAKINNTNPYSLSNPSLCECRNAFNWQKTQFMCRIDCNKIWGANKRVDDVTCSCDGDKVFNPKQLSCDAASAQALFGSVWTIIGFAICIIVFVIIMIILVRYCWQFKTKNNKEHEKKLKTNDQGQKPRKKKLKKEKDLLENNNLLSDQRLRTKTTL